MPPPDFSKIPLARPPPGVRPNFINPPSDAWQYNAAAATGTIFAFLFLVLRLYTRIFLVKMGRLEDVLLVVAFILSRIMTIFGSLNGKNGAGVHSWDVLLSHLSPFLLLKFICMVCYILALMFVKLAILGLFFRFNPLKKYRYCVCIMAAVVFVSSIGAFISLLLRCDPVSDQWSINHPNCKNNVREWVIATSSINITIDSAMLLFPIPLLWEVLLPKRQKIGIVLIMMTGSLIGFFSIARLVKLVPVLNDLDATYKGGVAAIYSTLEVNIAIICACLPSLKPFFKRHLKGLLPQTKFFSSYSQFSRGEKPVVAQVDGKGRMRMIRLSRILEEKPSQTFLSSASTKEDL